VPLAAAQVARPRTALAAAALLASLVLAACGGGASTGSSGVAGGGSSVRASSSKHASAPVHRDEPALIAPANPTPRTVRIPVLTYHRVHQYATELVKSLPDLTVEPSVFFAEIEALSHAGYHSISIRQLFDALYHGASLPSKPVLISVDDGYVDDVRSILPVLAHFHMRATFFVITGRIADAGFLTAAEMRQLDAAGMDVEDHTQSHVDLPAQTPSQLVEQVAGSKRALESILGHPVSAFAYPFGTYNSAVVDEVRKAGYALAFTTMAGNSASTSAPLLIPRIHVGRSETSGGLLSILGGDLSGVSSSSTG
jgi:peptidoglycan/xylan/chitin deacetylase (PgdA/CDA1 family)